MMPEQAGRQADAHSAARNALGSRAALPRAGAPACLPAHPGCYASLTPAARPQPGMHTQARPPAPVLYYLFFQTGGGGYKGERPLLLYYNMQRVCMCVHVRALARVPGTCPSPWARSARGAWTSSGAASGTCRRTRLRARCRPSCTARTTPRQGEANSPGRGGGVGGGAGPTLAYQGMGIGAGFRCPGHLAYYHARLRPSGAGPEHMVPWSISGCHGVYQGGPLVCSCHLGRPQHRAGVPCTYVWPSVCVSTAA